MRTHRFRLAAALVVAAAVTVAVPSALGGAASGPTIAADQASNSDLWFVELSGSPDSFRKNAAAAGIEYQERFAFTKLWNGVSIRSAASQVTEIKRLSGVKAVYPVLTVDHVPTPVDSPELATALAMTGADVAQSELGYTGAGVKVAVMDTGVDYDHADLGGDGVQRTDSGVFPTGRVTHGFDFVGDAFDANPANPTYNPVATPDPRPDDCQGHGTHVAGIVGASGDITGVAPGVTFGAYRVFGCNGSTTADIMIAAMEQALEDGMDILNMSIGSAFQTWPQYPTAAASDALVDAGMVVVASIGNSGASGVYSAGAPGVGRNVIGVASFDNSHINALTFDVNPSGRQVAYLPLATTPDPPTSGTTDEVVFVGRGCVSSLGDTHAADPDGKVALIIRGDCTFQEKYQGAADAGATGVVIYNNVTGLFAGGGVTSRDIPGVGISNADGVHIRSLLDGGETVTFTWTDQRVNASNPTGGLISSFSSYGLTAELDLKPDIGAPGGLIRSTYPLEKGGAATISGTSMSSPHVAGAAALLMEARPSLAAADFRTVLQNSAEPKGLSLAPSVGPEPVHRQGAGMVQIDRSILATTTISPGKIALGEGTGGTTTLTIRNDGSSDVTYDLSHRPAISTGGSTFSPGLFFWHQSASFSASSVTVPAGGAATVDVTISGPERQGRQYGGYVVFTPQGGGQTYRVPYAGFGGDYQAIQVLAPTSFGFPWLAKLQDGTFTKQEEDGAVYSLAGGDHPYFLVHLAHQSRQLEFTVFDAASGKPLSGKGQNPNFFSTEFVRRHSAQSGADFFFAFAWDGTLRRTEKGVKTWESVPDGDYFVVVKALKALGDPANPAHTETWTSPTFTIDRP